MMKCEDCFKYIKCVKCQNSLKWIKCASCLACKECEKCKRCKNCEACDKKKKCPNCGNCTVCKEDVKCEKCANCLQCLSLQKCHDCKVCENCVTCNKCLECTECMTMRRQEVVPQCENCEKQKKSQEDRPVDIYCSTCQREVCSKCGSKFHKKCILHDTFDLVIESQKLIDSEKNKLDKVEKEKKEKKEVKEDNKANPEELKKQKEEGQMTIVEIKESLKDIKDNMIIYTRQEDELKNNITKAIDKKFKEVDAGYNALKAELNRLEAGLEKQDKTMEARRQQLEEIRLHLETRTKDENFQDVLKTYKELKAECEIFNATGKRANIKRLRDRIQKFKNEEPFKDIQNNTQNLFQKGNKLNGGFQDCYNIVYLTSPYSYYMYTYDMDTHEANVITLVDKEKKEFRMKYNCSTLFHNNQFFFIGGADTLDESGKNCWSYSYLHKCLKELKPMTVARREHGVVFAYGFIYSVGGWTNDGLTPSCEKMLVDRNGEDASDAWGEVKSLNSPKTVVSLCTVQNDTVIYAIGGLAKDARAHYFERLMCLTDEMPQKREGGDVVDKNCCWETLEILDNEGFLKENQMIGSFSYQTNEEEFIMIFNGAEKSEDSIAYKCKLSDRSLTKFDCPNLVGCGSLHGRKPLYTNGNKDIYFVGFYDILHFNVATMKWEKAIETKDWISYK